MLIKIVRHTKQNVKKLTKDQKTRPAKLCHGTCFRLNFDGEAVKVRAQYKICFADEVRETPSSMEEAVSFNAKDGWGYDEFIKREDLEKSKHLKDDSFSIRCDIVVVNKFRAEKEGVSQIDTPVFVSVPPSDLHQYYGDLLRTENGADVVFEVGAKTFAAHRCVLAIRSSVFSAELFGSMKEGNTTGVVCIDDMEAQVFKALLHFVYTDSLPEANKEDEEVEEDVMTQHLLVAADRYNLERLKLICEDKLCRYIDAGTVATVLTLAKQHHCNGLKKACFNFLSSWANLKAAMATDGFDHLTRSCPSIMKELLAVNRT
jgi:speckle-type POZ protein